MRFSHQQKTDVIAEVLEQTLRAQLSSESIQRSCLHYSAFTAIAIAKRGARAILQAGSASWLFKAAECDDGAGATHYSYEFAPHDPLSATRLAAGFMPEMHCWAAIPATGEIVDLTTRHLPDLLHQALPHEKWTAPIPPPFFWGQANTLPRGWSYVADRTAIEISLALLVRRSPDLFTEMRRRGIAPWVT